MNQREREILDIIKKEPLISQKELSERLGIQRSSVAGYIMGLTRAGIIRGRGYLLSDPEALVVIGGANMDIQGSPRGEFQWGESHPGQVRVSAGGVGRNAAENLARLGFPVTLLTAVGDDENGRILRRVTQNAGVSTEGIRILSGRNTATYLSLLDEQGDLAGAVADMAVTQEITPQYLMDRRELIEQARAVVLDANLPGETLQFIAEGFRDVPLFADPVSAAKAVRMTGILPRVHTLKPNLREAEVLLGRAIQGEEDARRAVSDFLERGIQQVFLSLGSGGLTYGTVDGIGHLPPPAGDVPPGGNTTGAGDAFLAGVTAAWMRGLRGEQAAGIGTRAARLTISCSEAVYPALTWEKIESEKEGLKV